MVACILLNATLAVSKVFEYIGENNLRRNQWHKHDLAGRVDMPCEREERLLYIRTKESHRFLLATIISCSLATLIAWVTKYSYVFGHS